MTGLLPELEVEDVGSDDLLVATGAILLAAHIHQLVVNVCTSWVPESASWSETEVSEQVLCLADGTMITTLSLFSEVHVLIELLLRGERNGVDSLQTIIGDLSEPVGSRVFHDFEALDQLGGGDVRARA